MSFSFNNRLSQKSFTSLLMSHWIFITSFIIIARKYAYKLNSKVSSRVTLSHFTARLLFGVLSLTLPLTHTHFLRRQKARVQQEGRLWNSRERRLTAEILITPFRMRVRDCSIHAPAHSWNESETLNIYMCGWLCESVLFFASLLYAMGKYPREGGCFSQKTR